MTYEEAVDVAKRALEVCPVSLMKENGYDRAEVEEALEVLGLEAGEG